MIFSLLKSFLLGICAAVPVGPVMLFVLQKTLNYGRKAGLVSGLGSACMDTIYAAISFFILAIAENFIDSHEVLIALVGGIIILVVGVVSFFKGPVSNRKNAAAKKDKYSAGFAAQTFLMALANPAALFVMFGLSTILGIEAGGYWNIACLCMVFAGELSYWALFSWFFSKICKSVNCKTLSLFSKLTSVAIVIFGIVLIVDGLVKI